MGLKCHSSAKSSVYSFVKSININYLKTIYQNHTENDHKRFIAFILGNPSTKSIQLKNLAFHSLSIL